MYYSCNSGFNYCLSSTTSPYKDGVKVSFQTVLTVPKCDSNPQIEGFGISASFILLKWTSSQQEYEQIKLKSKSSRIV